MIYNGVCPTCSTPFTWDSANKGRKRKYCSTACNGKAGNLGGARGRDPFVPCSTPDCGRSPVFLKTGLCHACTSRMRRYGTVELQRPHKQPRKVEVKGYVSLYKPDHPLRKKKGGRIMEHRVVLYEELGGGEHPCYWCGDALPWDQIVVDHLNEEKADNRPSNLVPSCNRCNRARGQQLYFLAGLSDGAFETFLRCAEQYRRKHSRRKDVA